MLAAGRLPRIARPSRVASTWLRRGLLLVGGAAVIGAAGLALATQASAVAAPVDPARGVSVEVEAPDLGVAAAGASPSPVLALAVEPLAAVRETVPVVAHTPAIERVARPLSLPAVPAVALVVPRTLVVPVTVGVVVPPLVVRPVEALAVVRVDLAAAVALTRSVPSAASPAGWPSGIAVVTGASSSSDGSSPVGPGGSGGSGGNVAVAVASSAIGARGAGGQVAVGLALATAVIGACLSGVVRGDAGPVPADVRPQGLRHGDPRTHGP